MKATIYDLSRLNNVNHKSLEDCHVAYYEDHRTIINVLHLLFEINKYEDPLDIVLFDDHDDFIHVSDDKKDQIELFLDKPGKRFLSTIVEFDLNGLDDDWITAGMELGYIGNVFLFNATQSNINFKEQYSTRRFGDRTIYNIGNVWAALGHRGELNDPIKHLEFGSLWSDFGWELKEGKFDFKNDRNKFIFDIDLDCFSTTVLDHRIAIPYDIITERLTENLNPSYHYYNSAQIFMRTLMKNSELVTMCFEKGCCGGIRESNKIFDIVDEVLFNNELG